MLASRIAALFSARAILTALQLRGDRVNAMGREECEDNQLPQMEISASAGLQPTMTKLLRDADSCRIYCCYYDVPGGCNAVTYHERPDWRCLMYHCADRESCAGALRPNNGTVAYLLYFPEETGGAEPEQRQRRAEESDGADAVDDQGEGGGGGDYKDSWYQDDEQSAPYVKRNDTVYIFGRGLFPPSEALQCLILIAILLADVAVMGCAAFVIFCSVRSLCGVFGGGNNYKFNENVDGSKETCAKVFCVVFFVIVACVVNVFAWLMYHKHVHMRAV